eukprot:2441264-Pleurochrysis_carterae.AAC.1
MAVSRVYWGCALRNKLQTAYHRTRSLKFRSTHVGWDVFIERVNLNIRRDTVDASISELLERTGESQKRAPVEIDVPVKAVVEFLDRAIKTTFDEACDQSDANLLGLDLSKLGGRSSRLYAMRFDAVEEGEGSKHRTKRLPRLCC